MQRNITPILAALAGSVLTPVVQAQVDLYVDPVNNSSQLTGYVTQDLKVDTANDWTSAAVLLELDAGSIYQDGFGNDTEPDSFLIAYYPSVAFDTYLTGGGQWG